jgi:tetratricopeptide (TPR) repeat protein
MFKHLAELLGYSPAAPFDAQTAQSVLLSALAGQVCFASYVGYDEAQDALARTCAPEVRARGLTEELGACLLALGTNACYVDDYPEAATFLEESVAFTQSAGDSWSEAVALSWLGFVWLLQNELEAARTAFEASHQIALDMGQPLLPAFTVSKLGLLADASGDYAQAMRLHTEANGYFETLGDRGGAGYALSRASVSAYCLGDFEEALRLGRAGHDGFADVNHRWGMIGAACRVGFALVALGNPNGARERFGWALDQAQATGAKSLALLALSGVGVLLAREGDKRRAFELLTFVFGCPGFPPFYFITAKPELDRLEAELPPEEVASARAAAQAADFEAVVTAAEQLLAGESPALRA